MGYKSLVKRQLRGAFRASKDLLTSATLTKVAAAGFDFNTQAVSKGTPIVSTVSGLFKAKTRVAKSSSDENNAISASLILNADDYPDMTEYDTVTINGIVWNAVPPMLNDGYLITIKLVRSV